MTTYAINNPFEVFTDINGEPLEAGYIYIGEPNQNPITNPITVYWDDSFVYPASQPIRTIGGFASRNGSPGDIFINPNIIDSYSILIKNKKNEIVFSDYQATSLINITNYGEVSVKWFGAIGDGVHDDTQAIINAIAYAESGTGGNTVYFPKGQYLTSAAIETNAIGTILKGAGPVSTRILASHANGDVIRLKRQYNAIEEMELNSTGARSGATNTDGFGLRLEYEDIPETTDVRTRMCTVRHMVVLNQPATGIYFVGPSTGASRIESCRIKDNRGHGIVLDRGFLSGRVNKSTVATPGVMNIENVMLQNNAGHGLACGNPADTASTPSLRVFADNMECTDNATDAAVRFSNDQVWLLGTNHEVRTSVFQADGTGGGIRVDGRNYHIKNNRFINLVYSVYVDNAGTLQTQGIYIDGMTVLDLAQDPAVVVASGADKVRVGNLLQSNVTSVITPDVPDVIIDWVPQIVRKTTSQTINNSSTLQNDSELRYYLRENLEYIFECCVETESGSPTPNIKIAFTVPSGAILHWSSANGIKADITGSITQIDVITGSGTSDSFYSAVNKNTILLSGFVDMGSNSGYLQLQWAQNAATAVNTTVNNRISYIKIWRLY